MSHVVWARETERTCFHVALQSSQQTRVTNLIAQLSLVRSMKFSWGAVEPHAGYKNWWSVELGKLAMTHDILPHSGACLIGQGA